MKLGLILPLFSGDAERVLSFAERAEELGFDGVFAFDHLFPPGGDPERPVLEAFAMLGAVSRRTSRISVGTLVARVALRNAGVLARLATTLDDASAGRMILGVGAGDAGNDLEHEVFDIPAPAQDERREHLEETVRCVRALFGGGAWPGGSHVPAMPGPLLPPPRAGGPPIWIGGSSDRAVRLAAREGDAWNGWQMEPGAFADKARLLHEEAGGRKVEATWAGVALVGRDDADVAGLLETRRRRGLIARAWTGTPGSLRAGVAELERAGATWVVLALAGPRDRLELVGSQVLPALGSRP
ncbi:MAG TPA: LLM class flavin-dependent oxidoreductase [Actinomycetota bacterium]|nr:LLM class flavin-dependent oxidoreductase [Actinomycetota bacterium]